MDDTHVRRRVFVYFGGRNGAGQDITIHRVSRDAARDAQRKGAAPRDLPPFRVILVDGRAAEVVPVVQGRAAAQHGRNRAPAVAKRSGDERGELRRRRHHVRDGVQPDVQLDAIAKSILAHDDSGRGAQGEERRHRRALCFVPRAPAAHRAFNGHAGAEQPPRVVRDFGVSAPGCFFKLERVR